MKEGIDLLGKERSSFGLKLIGKASCQDGFKNQTFLIKITGIRQILKFFLRANDAVLVDKN